MFRRIAAHRYALRCRERRDHRAACIEDLDANLSGCIRVDEEVPALESQRPCDQARSIAANFSRHPCRPLIAHRREAVAPQRRQPGAAPAGKIRALNALAPADVEIQSIADDRAAAARGLHVGEVPIALFFRHADEGVARRSVPMEAVAAEADADVVGLFARALLAAVDGEEAEHHALVGRRIQVVELRLAVQFGTAMIRRIGADP
jgi:hypothetical protein